jgi:hypothetical protein
MLETMPLRLLAIIDPLRVKKVYQVLNFMYYIVILQWKVIQIPIQIVVL